MKAKKTDPIVPKNDKKKKVALSKRERKKKKKQKPTKNAIDDSNGLNPNAFYIVPWRKSSDWQNVCNSFNDGKYEDVIKELCIWRERVPSLPVGAESTIFLLQAIVADQQNKSEDEARSLYSLAVVRYLNHVSHLATKEMGENAPVPLTQLVSHLSVPEWIVELRHHISHGITLPSIDILRQAADFIKTWLKDNYWVDPSHAIENRRPDIEILTNRKENKESKEEKYFKMCNTISAFIASKIYHLRSKKLITDPEITQYLINQPGSVKPKMATGLLKTKIANFFATDPNLLCTALANEMIPHENFLGDFCNLFNIPSDNETLVFEKYYQVWAPLIELIQTRGKLRQMCTLLGKEHVTEGTTKTVKLFTALWLDNLLEKMEQEEKVFPFRLKSLLLSVISNANEFTKYFFSRLLSLLENHIGEDKARQLETLFNIWMDETSTEKIRRDITANANLFTIDDLPSSFVCPTYENSDQSLVTYSIPSSSKRQADWDIDYRDSHFWRKVPLGGEI